MRTGAVSRVWQRLTRTQRMMVAGAAVLLLVVIIRSTACRGPGDSDFDRGGFAVSVEVAPVKRGSIRHTVRFVGSVEPYESVRVVPKITGILNSFPVQIGDWVDEGDLIATIDEAEYLQRLDQARANLGLAEARLERSRINLQLAGRELERVASMAEQGLTSDQQLDQVTSQRDGSRADVQLAEADVTRARAAYDEAQINFENTRIVARLGGSVDKRQVDAGTLVSPTTPLCTIVRTDPAKVVVNVPEGEIGLLRVGGQAMVTAAAGIVEVAGVVERISPTVDPATRTMVAEIVVPNSAGVLRPGMYADVILLIEEKADAVLVPERALVRRDEATEVFLVDGGVARATPVEAGIVADGVAEALGGLAAGDLVVVRGQYLLNDGDPVRFDAGSGEGGP